MAVQYSLTDEAPFAVPSDAKSHYVIEVTSTVTTLAAATDLVTSAALGEIVSNADADPRYPKAVSLAAIDTTADVWLTVDGQTPVVGTTAPVGVKVPPTYPTLRIPYPSGIRNDTIKIISDSVAGTPVVLYFDW